MNLNFQNNVPEEVKVILEQDSLLTDVLLFLNIAVTIFIAYVIRNNIERKAKEYEVKAHIKKISAEKIIDLCLKLNKTFRQVCLKNPTLENISSEEIEEIDRLRLSEEMIFLSEKSKKNINEFRDYIFNLIIDPSSKDPFKEKSYFFLIKKILDEL